MNPRRNWRSTLDDPTGEKAKTGQQETRKRVRTTKPCSTPGCEHRVWISKVGLHQDLCGRCRSSRRHDRTPRNEYSSGVEGLLTTLAEIRLDAGISQAGFGRLMGRSHRYAGRLESGDVELRVEHLREWAEAFDLEVTITFRRPGATTTHPAKNAERTP